MHWKVAGYAFAALLCASAHAETLSTTLFVTNTTGSLGATGITFSGSVDLSNISKGTITGNIPLTPVGANLSGPVVITLTNGDKINGTLTFPASALAGGGSVSGSMTITGGTGQFAGATGSFPNLSGAAALVPVISLNFSGAGTIITASGGGGGGGGTGGGGGGGGTTPTGPVITDVLDAGSYTKGIAQGGIFVVKGSNLSAAGFTQFSFPLPTTASGVKITFTPTTGGAGTDAYLVYLYNQSGVNQLAALLPSTVNPGNYNVTVTNNGATSANFSASVQQRKLGLITADSSGSGLAVVQSYVSATRLDINRLTTFTASGFNFGPAHPGQVLIAWATGMGPVTGGDNTASAGFNFAANGVTVRVLVGGVSITPDYAGRTPGLAGTDQINFTLPANVPTGCAVPFQVSVNGTLSNSTFIAIAPDANGPACAQPGFTTEQLTRFDQGATYTTGGFVISQIQTTAPGVGTIKSNVAAGQFARYSGLQFAALAQAQAQITSSGACTVIHSVTTAAQAASQFGQLTGLDAGAVTLTGPAGSNLNNTPFTLESNLKTYSIFLGTEGLPVQIPGSINASLVAGNYTVRGAGGKDVGSFSTTIGLGSPLVVTGGLPSTVVRNNGLTLNWTGGNASDLVQITGSSSTTTGTGTNATVDSWSFVCTTNAGARTFTVPPSVLNQLPAVGATSTGGGGSLSILGGATTTFTAPLTAGGNIDTGVFAALVGSGGTVSYQ